MKMYHVIMLSVATIYGFNSSVIDFTEIFLLRQNQLYESDDFLYGILVEIARFTAPIRAP